MSTRLGVLILTFLWSTVVYGQVVEYVHTDALGSPVAITNESGQIIERSDYEPYGNLIGKTNNDRPGYTGHVMDSATGLTYMQQRYYDPTIGRFLSTDPVQANASTGASFNRYDYANNNPYRFTDPDGRQSCDTCNVPPTGVPAADRLTTPPSDREGLGQTIAKQFVFELSQAKSRTEIAVNFLMAASLGIGAVGEAAGGTSLVAKTGGTAEQTVTVGRWMSNKEMNGMVSTGRVQESSLNGVTSVSSPPNPGAWVRQTTAPNYVQFDVAASAVRPAGSANAKIYGPNSVFGPKLGITAMPKATNIVQTACRVPFKC